MPAGGDARLRPRATRRELDRRTTFFLAIDSVGGGDVRFETSAGWLVSYAMDRRLIELCGAIAEADAEGDGAYGAAPLATARPATRCPRGSRGMRAIGITCRDADGDRRQPPPADRRAGARRSARRSTARTASRSSSIRRLDADLGRAAPGR